MKLSAGIQIVTTVPMLKAPSCGRGDFSCKYSPLDKDIKYAHSTDMASYSTGQVAQQLGIDKKTLLRWLYAGKVAEPKLVKMPASAIRVWTERDLKRAMQFKEQNYRKGRGRKKQT